MIEIQCLMFGIRRSKTLRSANGIERSAIGAGGMVGFGVVGVGIVGFGVNLMTDGQSRTFA